MDIARYCHHSDMLVGLNVKQLMSLRIFKTIFTLPSLSKSIFFEESIKLYSFFDTGNVDDLHPGSTLKALQ